MKQLSQKRLAGVVIGTIALFAAPAFADQLADMAARLSKLRGEVETLSAELATESADGRDELRSLARQKADLEAEIKKEQTRAEKIRRAINDKKKSVQEAKSQDGEMAPLFEKSLAQVRAYVKTTLPFRTSDRVSELDKLESQYNSGLLSAPKAVGRLWSFMEDEFRLTRENGLYQQTVLVDGQPQLAEVVRIGMVMLYFKAGDTLGRAVKKDGEWTYEKFTSSEDAKAVLSLFESFKKQIRAGYFEIPSALPGLTEGPVTLPDSVLSAMPDKPKAETPEAPEGTEEEAAAKEAAATNAAAKDGATGETVPGADALAPKGGVK